MISVAKATERKMLSRLLSKTSYITSPPAKEPMTPTSIV